MANEIKIQASIVFHKGGTGDGLDFSGSFTFTGTAHLKGEQNVGFAAEEPLLLGDVVAGGWLIIKNTDATNFVSVRGASGQTPLVKIPPSGVAGPFVLHPSATAPTVRADTAAVRIRYLILEP